ncbi:hypothetical protein ACQKMV_15595 [Lysinibacillus sp. NPDC094403]|uniref:hypothetical protein n=1 Tax=Lysinibacillus sp. NPDC094403 TaxID=3390581 RepID=UPI003D026CD4
MTVMKNMFLTALINFFVQPFTNVMMDSKTEQRNGFWVWVAILIIVIAAFYAACYFYGANFTGNFNFLGIGFEVECKK